MYKIKYFFISLISSLSLFNIFLETSYFEKLVYNYNNISYFYLELDWNKKTYLFNDAANSSTFLFLGSSRTAYSINPDQNNLKNLINLGLVGASAEEIFKVSTFLRLNKIKVKKIFLEINPMSFTRRHMSAMKDLNQKELNTPKSQLEFRFNQILLKIPMIKYKDILSSTVSGLFRPTNPFRDLEYSQLRHDIHFSEFLTVKSENYKGYIKGQKINNSILRERFYNECLSMIKWNLSEKGENFLNGIKIFNSTVENLKLVADEIVLWIPPEVQNENYGITPEKFSSIISQIKAVSNLPIVDFRAEYTLNTKNNFMDCIHPSEDTSQAITNYLLEFKI